jgi:hypothetical protein
VVRYSGGALSGGGGGKGGGKPAKEALLAGEIAEGEVIAEGDEGEEEEEDEIIE